MNSAAQTFISIANHVIFLLDTAGLDAAARDAGFFYIIANGLQLLRENSRIETIYLMDEFNEKENMVTMTPVYLMLASVLLGLFACIFLVRPIVLRVEHAKTQVVDMFLDIPRRTRMKLRRQVVIVLKHMRREEDTALVHLSDDEDDDSQDDTEAAPEPRNRGEASDAAARYKTRVSQSKRPEPTYGEAAPRYTGYVSGRCCS